MIRASLIGIAITLTAIATFTTGAISAPGFKPKHRDVRTRIELSLNSNQELKLVRIAVLDPGRVQTSVQSITDMLVILSARGSDIDAILRLPDGQKPRFGRALFRARVFTVTRGRIHTDTAAWCSSWHSNLSRCELDCDGGTFSLQRLISSQRTTRLDLMIGASADGTLIPEPGFLINACQYENTHQLRVIPARGHKLVPLALTER